MRSSAVMRGRSVRTREKEREREKQRQRTCANERVSRQREEQDGGGEKRRTAIGLNICAAEGERRAPGRSFFARASDRSSLANATFVSTSPSPLPPRRQHLARTHIHVRAYARKRQNTYATRIDVACHARAAVLTAEASRGKHSQAEPQTIFTSARTSGERSHFLHSGAHTSL